MFAKIKESIPAEYLPFVIDLYYKIRLPIKLIYFGQKYYCPICNGCFRKFLPGGFRVPVLKKREVVGGGFCRESAVCPYCRSVDRERLVYLFLSKNKDILREKIRLLHVAPERWTSKFLRSRANIDYLSIDLCDPLAMEQMDITALELSDNSFNVIICNHVLEHIRDDSRAMAELYRVLRPGGWAIIQVPISKNLKKTFEDPKIKSPGRREKAFGHQNHLRIYAQDDYSQRLKTAGFIVERYSFAKEEGRKTARRYGLVEDEDIFLCSKPKIDRLI